MRDWKDRDGWIAYWRLPRRWTGTIRCHEPWFNPDIKNRKNELKYRCAPIQNYSVVFFFVFLTTEARRAQRVFYLLPIGDGNRQKDPCPTGKL